MSLSESSFAGPKYDSRKFSFKKIKPEKTKDRPVYSEEERKKAREEFSRKIREKFEKGEPISKGRTRKYANRFTEHV